MSPTVKESPARGTDRHVLVGRSRHRGRPGSRTCRGNRARARVPTGTRPSTSGNPMMWSAWGCVATTTSRRLTPKAARSVADLLLVRSAVDEDVHAARRRHERRVALADVEEPHDQARRRTDAERRRPDDERERRHRKHDHRVAADAIVDAAPTRAPPPRRHRGSARAGPPPDVTWPTGTFARRSATHSR